MTPRHVFIAAIALLACCAASAAEKNAKHAAPQQPIVSLFDRIDTNHDGKIDAKEVAASPPIAERNLRVAQRMLAPWDANGDGVVTAEEFNRAADARFKSRDRGNTGKLAKKTPLPQDSRPHE